MRRSKLILEWMQPWPDVPVERAAQAVFRVQPLQAAQVVAGALRRDCGVLPARPVIRSLRRERGRAQACLADRPQLPLLLRVLEQRDLFARDAVLPRRIRHEPPRALIGLLLRVGAELDEEPGAVLVVGRKLRQLGRVHVLLPLVLEEDVVDRLQPDRPVLGDPGHLVSGQADVLERDHDEHALEEARRQQELGLEHGGAGALGAGQRAREVEAVLRQQLVEVVARHAARQALRARKAAADQRLVALHELREGPVDLGAAAPAGHDRRQLLVGRLADPHPLPVVGGDLQRVDVVRGARPGAVELRLHRVDPAGVVADVAADGAVAVRRGIGAEDEAPAAGVPVDLLVDRARPADDRPRLRVGIVEVVQVLGEIDHDGGVDRLAREARAAASGQDRGVMLAADPVCRDDVVERPRDHYSDRLLAVVRRVRRVEGAAGGPEANLALELPRQVVRERAAVDGLLSGHASAEAPVDAVGNVDAAVAQHAVDDAHQRSPP